MMETASGYAEVEGGRLFYERAGEGFPVVLIHPGLWDSRIWDDQFAEFAQHHDVVRYDVRGYGRSDVPSVPYSDLRDLHQLLVELRISRCAIVGCSMGGQLAIDFALAHPDVAEAIVPVAPGLSGYEWSDPGIDALSAQVREALNVGDLETAMALQLAAWAPFDSGAEVDRRIREIAMANTQIFGVPDTLVEPPPSAVDRLGRLEAATLLLVGEHDVAEIHRIVDLLVERVPGASKREIHDADMLVNVRQPDVFNRVVLDFLSFRG